MDKNKFEHKLATASSQVSGFISEGNGFVGSTTKLHCTCGFSSKKESELMQHIKNMNPEAEISQASINSMRQQEDYRKTWGVILAIFISLAVIGVFFAFAFII